MMPKVSTFDKFARITCWMYFLKKIIKTTSSALIVDFESTKRLSLFYYGNKVKWRISKRVLQENKTHQILRKTNISY